MRAIPFVLSAIALVACGKAPAPAAPAAPAASAALTYRCSSPQKSRAIFLRFGDDGALSLGADAASLKPTGEVVLFDKSGHASWTTTLPNGSEANSFEQTTKEWVWQERDANGQVIDQATYSCKPL